MQLKKLAPKLALAGLALSGAAFAQTAAPQPDAAVSYNIGAVTDYRYRGISQTGRRPALQGGVDYAHGSGFYAGAWASTIRWIKDSSLPPIATAKGPVELDLYGGYKGSVGDLGYDVGGLYYWYVGNTLKNITGENANTFEVYGAVSYNIFTAKYSHSVTHLFGAPDSKNSGYLDLSAAIDLGNGFSLTPHVGWQRIRNFGTYRDYSLTAAKDFGGGLVVSVAVVGTNWEDRFGFPYMLPGSGTRDLAKTGLVAGIKKTF